MEMGAPEPYLFTLNLGSGALELYNFTLNLEMGAPQSYIFFFCEKHTTQQVINSLVEKMTESWDTGDIVIGIFLDLKKSFNTVSHDILLKKMYAYGIIGNAFKLLKSYLTGRIQYVIYDGVQSTTLPIKCGVHQGSILGPLLFICSMNDIGNISDFLYTILYADDTSVLLNGNNYSNLIELLNFELEK